MRCNIYKPLSCDTGELLMFSQYADDITAQMAGPTNYRVVPNKFAVLNLDINAFKDFIVDTVYEGTPQDLDLNKEISQYLQSYYENMICTAHNQLTDSENPIELDENDDGYAGQLLWKALKHANLISYTDLSEVETGFTSIEELHFIGEINVHSNRIIDGMNYNDIYCYLSPNDGDMYYHTDLINVGTTDPFVTDNTQCISGWTEVSYPTNMGGMSCEPQFDEITGSSPSQQGIYELHDSGDSQDDQRIVFDEIPIDRNSVDSGQHAQVQNTEYMFNCIIIFYDIFNYNSENVLEDEPAYKNKPLGIYFTGPIELDTSNPGNPSYFIRNSVTKYVSNEDVFGQGSGWGLRLMTRIVPTPNSSTYFATVDQGDDYTTIAAALGRIADSIADVRTNMNNQMQQYQYLKDYIAEFRNYRTNVPYPKEINGVWYWFVNGRNTGRTIPE